MTIGMYYCVPIVAIYYFIGTQQPIHVTYNMFTYVTLGNLVFGSFVYIPICLFIDRPIYALLNLKRDVEEAVFHEHYKLVDYLDNFRHSHQTNDQVIHSRLAVAYGERIKAKSGKTEFKECCNVQKVQSKSVTESSKSSITQSTGTGMKEFDVDTKPNIFAMFQENMKKIQEKPESPNLGETSRKEDFQKYSEEGLLSKTVKLQSEKL